MPDRPLIYVGGPFRAKTSWERTFHIRRAEMVGLRVAVAGATPVIPHTMYGNYDGTFDDEFWLDVTMRLLQVCEGMFVCDGWERSQGTLAEIADCEHKGRPVFHTFTKLEKFLKARA